MDALSANPLILAGLAAAAAIVLLLLLRRRPPRRIGMDRVASGGTVSRKRRATDRTPPPAQPHAAHEPNWRTAAKPKPQAARSAAVAIQGASLHQRLQALAEAGRQGRKVAPDDTLKAVLGSREAQTAIPGVFRLARLAILAWMGLWGFGAVAVLVSAAIGEADDETIAGLGFVVIPLFLGIAGLRALKRFQRRAEDRMAKGGR